MPRVNFKCGIYQIINLISNKRYIGYSAKIERRIKKHKDLLCKSMHNNEHLQNAFNIYGYNNFSFECIEECSEDVLCEREHYWCNHFNVHNNKYGYNIRPTDPKEKCVSHSKETRDKLSKVASLRGFPPSATIKAAELRKGGKMSQYNKERLKETNDKRGYTHLKSAALISSRVRSKVVLQYDLEGNFIKEYYNGTQAALELNINKHCIGNCCRGTLKKYNNYIWKYKN